MASDRVGGEAVRDEIGDERRSSSSRSPAWRLVRLQSGPAGGPSFHEVGKGGWVRPADRSCVSGRHPIRIFEQRAYSSSTMDLKTILTRSSGLKLRVRHVPPCGGQYPREVQPRKAANPSVRTADSRTRSTTLLGSREGSSSCPCGDSRSCCSTGCGGSTAAGVVW